MVTISQNQALQRWDTLPDSLRDAIISEANSDFIRKTCEAEHVPNDKISEVAKVAGYVLLGFIHPEDMGEELAARLKLDPKVCASIATSINGRIFAPVKKDLDAGYQPPSKLDMASGPKIMQDIGTGPRIVGTLGAIPIVGDQVKNAPPVARPTQAPTPTATPPATPKTDFAGAGWSRSTQEQPVVRLSQTSTPPPSGIPSGPSQRVTPPIQKPGPSVSINSSVGEFERKAILSGGRAAPPVPPSPGSAPAKPSPISTGPGPVILHEDASFKPGAQSSDFHLQLPAENFDMQKTGSASTAKPVLTEFGKTTPPQTPTVPTRVVHYTEYKSPSPETPTVGGSRQVTELTNPNPAPSVSIPKPPTPPTGAPGNPVTSRPIP